MRPRPLCTLFILLLGFAELACSRTDTSRAPAPQPHQGQNAPPTSAAGPLAQVDSLGVPAQIAPNDTLAVHLTGTVGPNGCYALARIETERSPKQVTLRPVVQPPTDADQMCTMAVVTLDTIHRIVPPFEPGPFTVTVPQPDRPPVTATVAITEGS